MLPGSDSLPTPPPPSAKPHHHHHHHHNTQDCIAKRFDFLYVSDILVLIHQQIHGVFVSGKEDLESLGKGQGKGEEKRD